MTGTDTLVLNDFAATLTNKTLTAPTIGDLTNMTHDHSNAAGGGNLTNSALTSGVFAAITGVGIQTQDLNISTNAIEFGTDLTDPASSTTYINADLQGLQYNAITSDTHSFQVAGVEEMSISATDINFVGNTVSNGVLQSDITGVTGITGVGTIASGTWEGTAVASAFLDADTMHLSVVQTITGNKVFQDNVFFIQNPAGDFEYQFIAAAIVADRILNLPLMTGTDEFVLVDFAATLTNKTIVAGSNTITGIVDANIDAHTSTKITINAKGQLNSNLVYTDQINTYGDFAQTFLDDQFFIQNPAGDFEYQFVAAAIIADRILNLPLLVGTDTLVAADFIQTLTQKTIDLDSNTLTGTVAEFNTALQSETFAFIGVANVWGTADQNIGATGKWQEAGIDISPIGTHDVFLDAKSFKELTTGGAAIIASEELGAAGHERMVEYMLFTASASEHATARIDLPQNWNASTIDVEICFYSATVFSASGTVRWVVRMIAVDEGDILTTNYGADTNIDVTPGVDTVKDLHFSAFTTITVAGSPSKGDLIFIDIERAGDDGADDHAGDARLISVRIRPTIDAATAT